MSAAPRSRRAAFDLALFETLNAEYRERRVSPAPPGQDEASRLERARRRLEAVAANVPLRGRTVVEFGCGPGHLTAQLHELAGAERVVGVDIKEYPTWSTLRRPGAVEFRALDVAEELPAPPGSVDAIVTSAVFEHVKRPLPTLAALTRLLADDGRVYLRCNLHRGPAASHRYREVFFPWPHLLFDDEVGREFYATHHGRRRSFAWVNRMTLAHYVLASREVGLGLVSLHRHVRPIDLPFYRRFHSVLGRYPALDLETNFVTLVMDRRDRELPRLEYVERQDALDRALAELP